MNVLVEFECEGKVQLKVEKGGHQQTQGGAHECGASVDASHTCTLSSPSRLNIVLKYIPFHPPNPSLFSTSIYIEIKKLQKKREVLQNRSFVLGFLKIVVVEIVKKSGMRLAC